MGELSEYCQRTVDDARRLGATRWTDEDRTAITTMGDRYQRALVHDDVTALASLFVEHGMRLAHCPRAAPFEVEMRDLLSQAGNLLTITL